MLVADGPNGPVATEPFAIQPEVYLDAVRRVLDFYRARAMCRMNRVKNDPVNDFCEACVLHLKRVFCQKGDNPGQDCPPEEPLMIHTIPESCETLEDGMIDLGDIDDPDDVAPF